MNGNFWAKKLMLSGCLGLVTITAMAGDTRLSLKRALSSKIVTIKAIATGGYHDKSLKLVLRNTSCKPLKIDIEPGMIFSPEDTTQQDLVLLGNESLALGADSTSNIQLQTYCGTSYARCPTVGQNYHFLKQGDSNMIRTLNYVKTNNVSSSVAQSAVWFFTNAHSLSSIYSYAEIHESEEMVKFIAKMMHLPIPEYYINYKTETRPGQPVIARHLTKIETVMHWAADEGFRHMHLVIYKENGNVYKTIEADQVIDKYGYTVNVELDPRRDPPGIYIIKLFDDANRVYGQKRVLIDPNEYAAR